MSPTPVVIVGCGGFGREVWAMVQALDTSKGSWCVEGFVDDCPSDAALVQVRALGSAVLGTVGDLAERRAPFAAVLAIGSPRARERVHAALSSAPVRYPNVIHPDATVAAQTFLGEGVVVAAGARLSTNVRIGDHVHLDQNVAVGHDTTIEAFSRLNPQACVSGGVTVGRGALVGANATILQDLAVGPGATVGAAACVVRDVPAGTVVKGVPAR